MMVFTEQELMAFAYQVDFATPDWLKMYYHGISAISTIISVFSMYVILFQSGKMDGYRFYLFYMQLAGWIMDLHLSTLMQFVPLFPVFGGYCTGILTEYFNVDDSFQATFTAFCICLVASALNSCFFRKHQAISKISNKYLLDDIPYAIILFLLNFFPFVASAFLYLSMLSKPDQVALIHEAYPNLVDSFRALPNYVVFDSNFWAIVTFAFIFFGCTYTLLLVVFTTYNMFKTLEDNRKHISSSNYAKHRATLRSLLAQFCACFLIIGPATLFSFLVVVRYEHCQVATHWIIVALTLHSSTNAIVMIITYPPYRNFVMLWKSNRQVSFS